MKTILILFIFLPAFLLAQTYIPITNNMTINSNSNIKFIPNNYTFTDPELNGVIQITGKHDIMLDGDSCTVNGVNYTGYMIKIDNSTNITIKNFDSVFKYKYAVYVTNSSHININGNDFSRNKVDSSGTIDVWADYTAALGGGVMMYLCRAAHIFNNIMKFQNDGVALYHCDSIKINDNDFAWNTSFGIRMFWTDTCNIYNNIANHINRPYTDPSDCAAILLIIANKNSLTNNDFSYSGDGIFLGQYQHSNIPNNNYFAGNECSYSPHNAIEATFADGNVYKHNKCNYSPYGFWLGYSFNSLVDSNEVIGNYNSGIAIDRGFNNIISNNIFFNNPLGIELWKGSPISGYANQLSRDYQILHNTLEGNQIAVSATTTTHAVIKENDFLYNQNSGVYLSDTAKYDTITGNLFKLTTSYHIKNNSVFNIYAPYNSFLPSDSIMINEKIYDKHYVPTKGQVQWYPYNPGPVPVLQEEPPCDMAEPSSVWYAYGDPGYGGERIPEVLTFDSTEKVLGYAAVKLETGRGYDVALNYRPFNDSISHWSLTDTDTLYFWVRTIRQPTYGFQYFSVRIGDSKGCFFKYQASPTLLNNANLVWKQYKFPLSGNNSFVRSSSGTMSLDRVNYVEIHADTWDYGFTIWVDGLQFSPCSPVTGIETLPQTGSMVLQSFPNPFRDKTTISYGLQTQDHVILQVFDMNGNEVKLLVNESQQSGMYNVLLDGSDLVPGVYLCRLKTSQQIIFSKIIKI